MSNFDPKFIRIGINGGKLPLKSSRAQIKSHNAGVSLREDWLDFFSREEAYACGKENKQPSLKEKRVMENYLEGLLNVCASFTGTLEHIIPDSKLVSELTNSVRASFAKIGLWVSLNYHLGYAKKKAYLFLHKKYRQRTS